MENFTYILDGEEYPLVTVRREYLSDHQRVLELSLINGRSIDYGIFSGPIIGPYKHVPKMATYASSFGERYNWTTVEYLKFTDNDTVFRNQIENQLTKPVVS